MTIKNIRFRMEGALCVLQVLEEHPRGQYESYAKSEWRDAAATDLLAVSAYTRAYDALEHELASLRSEVQSVRSDGNYLRNHFPDAA